MEDPWANVAVAQSGAPRRAALGIDFLANVARRIDALAEGFEACVLTILAAELGLSWGTGRGGAECSELEEDDAAEKC